MPIYEYKCGKCGKISEFLVGVIQEKIDLQCKSCGSKELQKILSAGVVPSGTTSRVPYECKSCPSGMDACNMGQCCPRDDE